MPTTQGELDALVRRSEARNAAVNITGMLWSEGKNFVQVLEGQQGDISDTMGRIVNDPRHTDIDIIFDRPVSRRSFGEWSMVRFDGSSQGVVNTAFLVGLALTETGPAARRLHDILAACDV